MIIGLIALLVSLFNSVAIFNKKKKTTTTKVVESIGTNPTTKISEKVVEQQEEQIVNTTQAPIFPMIFGQKGKKICDLQELILEIDPNALPKYGIDGNFDNETCNALTRFIGKGFIENEGDWNKLIELKK